jgi:PPOX class probable F420-dependent enzyme
MSRLNPFQRILGERHISLASFRNTGEAVRTPVWFAEFGGKLYLRTIANSGKEKRIRNNRRVKLAPCTIRGKVTGDWIDADACVLTQTNPNVEVADRVLDEKYGQERRDMTRLMREQGKALVYIELAPSDTAPK